MRVIYKVVIVAVLAGLVCYSGQDFGDKQTSLNDRYIKNVEKDTKLLQKFAKESAIKAKHQTAAETEKVANDENKFFKSVERQSQKNNILKKH